MSRQVEALAVLLDEERITLLEESRRGVAHCRGDCLMQAHRFATFTRAELDPVDVHPVASNREAEDVFALGQVHLGFDRIVFVVVVFSCLRPRLQLARRFLR